MSFDPRPLLKEIARGKHAARDLTREQARTLLSAILDDELEPVALGAVLVALRVKGESAEELAGMVEAMASHIRPLRLPASRAQPVIVPTYNGARKLPNLVPLLALLLAREGVPVLLHGARQEAQRVGTFEILAALGHETAASIDAAESALQERLIAAVPLEVLSPDLARLVDMRLTMGIRNTGHTLAKLLLPQRVEARSAARLIAVTHPDFMALMRTHFETFPANVFLMRGLEGEAVVKLHAPQPIEQVDADNKSVTHLPVEGEKELSLPARDAPATAAWTKRVVEGHEPVPPALARQVAVIAAHCKGAVARSPLRLVSSK